MEGFAYFPTIVYKDERPDFLKTVLPLALEYLQKVQQQNFNLVQSNHMGADVRTQELSNYLLLNSTQILQDQGYETNKYDFYISGLWAQEIKYGYGTNVHVHKNSQICGWYFLEVPEGSTYPAYYDVRMNKSMIELDFIGNETKHGNSVVHFKNIKAGTVMFGNSWMFHQLTGGTTEVPTRCIHFIVSHRDRLCNIC